MVSTLPRSLLIFDKSFFIWDTLVKYYSGARIKGRTINWGRTSAKA